MRSHRRGSFVIRLGPKCFTRATNAASAPCNTGTLNPSYAATFPPKALPHPYIEIHEVGHACLAKVRTLQRPIILQLSAFDWNAGPGGQCSLQTASPAAPQQAPAELCHLALRPAC